MVERCLNSAMISVITPIAPYHTEQAAEAQASVARQTYPGDIVWIPVYDTDKRGPGWARNVGVRQAQTPYIFFLDADDILEPDALLHAVEYHERGHYTYGDWIHYEKGVQVQPDCYQWDTPSHTVSTLMHRRVFEVIGGFNPDIDFEDSEFYLRAMKDNICGVHCPHPFIQYRPIGRRSVEAKDDPNRVIFLAELRRRYYGMGCCGDTPNSNAPVGQQQQGDVLVEAQWLGNKSTQGLVTGREYPRAGNGKQLWVAAEDAAMGALHASSGRANIRRVYTDQVEPLPDFEALKRRLKDMR